MIHYDHGTASAVTSPERRASPAGPRPAASGPTSVRRRHFLRELSAAVLLVAMAATFAMAVALFFDNGGATQFDTLGDALVSVGVLAALTTTNALLMMLLLAARVPVIDRVLGQPRATALHARCGEWVVLGLIVHATFVLVGYALLDGVGVVGEFALLWTDSSDFVLAVFGMAALLAVAVTSFVVVRRSLPYEAWHVVHLLSYAAIGLAIPHMFSMSGLLAAGSWRRAYWVGLLVVVGGALLGFRFVLPVLRSLRHQLRVARVVRLDRDTFHVEFSGRRLDKLGIVPGQFLRWHFATRRDWWRDHPFSVSAAPTPTSLRITVRAGGAGSAALAELTPGARVGFEGPYGTFTLRGRSQSRVVLVGAGSGIAPIRALLDGDDLSPGSTTVILRDSSLEAIPLLSEVARLCADRDARLIVLAGHRAHGRWVPDSDADLTLAELVPDVAAADLFVCGPGGFIDSVLADAAAAGVPRHQLHHERFTW